MDALCASEANTAGLAGTFLAAITLGSQASGNQTPPSDRMDQSGSTWVRPDGVKLFDNATDIGGQGTLLAPIQVSADGTRAFNESVWTGSSFFSGDNPACGGWSDGTATGIIGISALGGVSGASFNGAGCSSRFPLYCFQQ